MEEKPSSPKDGYWIRRDGRKFQLQGRLLKVTNIVQVWGNHPTFVPSLENWLTAYIETDVGVLRFSVDGTTIEHEATMLFRWPPTPVSMTLTGSLSDDQGVSGAKNYNRGRVSAPSAKLGERRNWVRLIALLCVSLGVAFWIFLYIKDAVNSGIVLILDRQNATVSGAEVRNLHSTFRTMTNTSGLAELPETEFRNMHMGKSIDIIVTKEGFKPEPTSIDFLPGSPIRIILWEEGAEELPLHDGHEVETKEATHE